MRLEICRRKITDDKMWMENAGDKINFRYFLKVLFVNKPSHIIELRLGEVQYLIFNCKQVKTFLL